MADVKISQLSSIGTIDISADVLPIVDTSATTTYKVTAQALVNAVLASPGTIGGTVSGVGNFTTLNATNLNLASTLSFLNFSVSGNGTIGGTLGVTGATTLAALSATTINGLTITSSTGTFTLTNGKTLSVSNTLTFTGTDSSSVAFGTGGTVIYSGGALGTPSSGTLTNCTGLPISSGVAGLGTSVATALAANVGSAGAFVVNGGALGSPSSAGTMPAFSLGGTVTINGQGFSGDGSFSGNTPTMLSLTSIHTAGTVLAIDNTAASSRGGSISFAQNGTVAAYFGTSGALLGSTSGNASIWATAGNGIDFYTNDSATAKMTIASSGAVTMATTLEVAQGAFLGVSSGSIGIGTNAPSASYKLDVLGNIRAFPTSGDSVINLRAVSGSGSYLLFAEASVANRGVLGFAGGSGNLEFRAGATTMATGTQVFTAASGAFNVTGTLSATGLLTVGGSTPASAAATGTAGTITWDSSYIYVCTATDTWKRAAIATW